MRNDENYQKLNFLPRQKLLEHTNNDCTLFTTAALPSSAHKTIQTLGRTMWTPPSACWNVFLQRLQLRVATTWNSWCRCNRRRFRTRICWDVLCYMLLLTSGRLTSGRLVATPGAEVQSSTVIRDPRCRRLSMTSAEFVCMHHERLCELGLLQHIVDWRNLSDDQIRSCEVPLPFR